MRLRKLSLPTRLSIAVGLTLLATTVVADVMAMRELRASLADSVAASLGGLIDRVARQVDQDIQTLRDLLAAEAARLDGMDPATAASALARRGAGLDFAFDYGILVVAASGEVAADSLERPEWLGRDVAAEAFFQRTFALGRPLTSEPIASPAPDATPVVFFTHPLRGRDGRIAALLAGGADLAANRFLAGAAGVRAGRSGQIGIFTLDGMVVAHTEPELLLQRFENPVATLPRDGDRFRTTEIVAADGQRALLAAAALANIDWLVAGVFPSVEVHAPIERGFAAAHRWFALGLAASAVLLWLVSTRAVRDLDSLARDLAALGDKKAGGRVGERYRGEAGRMADAVNAMLASLDLARSDVDDLAARLAGAEERERRAIAADLHDSVCQTLALANMRLGGAAKHLDDEAAATVREVRGLLAQSVEELKSLTFNLSPPILYELGLPAALEWLGREFSRKHALAVAVAVSGRDGPENETDIFLYRAANELLTNVVKHAGATNATLTAGADGGDYRVTVEDNGVGQPEALTAGNGFGLRNLRMRARQLGGSVTAESRPEGGVRVTVRIAAPPCNKGHDNA